MEPGPDRVAVSRAGTNKEHRDTGAVAFSTPVDAMPDDLDDRKRTILTYLTTVGGAVTVDELIDQLLAREPTETDTDRTDARERLAIALYHVHLPKLADLGSITYLRDERTMLVSVTPSSV